VKWLTRQRRGLGGRAPAPGSWLCGGRIKAVRGATSQLAIERSAPNPEESRRRGDVPIGSLERAVQRFQLEATKGEGQWGSFLRGSGGGSLGASQDGSDFCFRDGWRMGRGRTVAWATPTYGAHEAVSLPRHIWSSDSFRSTSAAP